MKQSYFLPLCLALLVGACEPRDPLPKATRIGANTFGCKINGKTYIPDGGGPFSGLKPIIGGLYVIKSSPLVRGIYIVTNASTKESLYLFLATIKPGTYELNTDAHPTPISQNYALYRIASGQTYMTSSINTGRVVISKCDTLTGIISGTFSFKAGAVNLNGQPNGTGTVEVTDGRFDVSTF